MTYQINIEEETKELARRYKDMLKGSYQELSDEDKKLIRKAFDLAVEAHKDQRRKSGEPYVYHPIAVAKIVANDIGLGATSIAAALLHDVVEDTQYTLEYVEKEFGVKIAHIVDGLTKISNLNKETASIQAENYRKMLLTLNDDVRVILIKIADRYHNMQTLEHMPLDKQARIASETLFIYAPLAHRLGLYTIKTELEDLGLKFTEPDVYYEILNKINESKIERDQYIAEFSKVVYDSLNAEGMEFEIKGRPKSIFSIRRKMMSQGVDFDEVYDKFAIRIIFKPKSKDEKHDAWKIYSIVTDHFTPNPVRLRDWMTQPKSTGYEALHTTVMGPKGHWVEVQIRSERMHEIAEKGYAAHYKYKQGEERETTIESWLNKLKDVLENTEANAMDFVENVRLNLYSKEIYTFTPNGQIKNLPKGSTAIDFAFAVHTEVGFHCRGAKINGKLVPLSRELNSGDQVEIITSANQKPKLQWLDYAVTSRARTKIKNSLKEDEKKMGEEGKELLQRKLKSLKLNFNEKMVNDLVNYFKLRTSLDLFFRVGNGSISNPELREFANQQSNALVSLFKKGIKRSKSNYVIDDDEITNKYDLIVFGKDEETLQYSMAKCCNPIPGDKVFGFITINEGIKIHKEDCPNAIDMRAKYGYRIMKAKWIDSTQREFKVNINVSGIDNVGIVNNVTLVISNTMNVNIQRINIDSEDGYFEGHIRVSVKNNSQLNEMIDNLKKIDGVMKVEREKNK
ncbi:MAG: bifunctional (p)ppGpp synthetase/guanosine-3',5'-bis(diphosphate) 3'-pyrophosphohydrolase [Flavobacteriaceae bacterium]|nr:bifunctional (p)ppGpp synthetase/guanosine-3',5'-bis(diphosphate) 3'-pyrophosphohydrolase [Flavobacteriaceae bacterium]